jgi:hypothetical protein
LSTNRIVDSIISRNKRERSLTRSFKDLRDIKGLFGWRALFFGLTPYTINNFTNNVEFFESTDAEFEHKYGFYWFLFTVALWNPLNILTVRMQCVDFPIRKFRHALWDMIKHDRLSMFYRGLFPVFAG